MKPEVKRSMAVKRLGVYAETILKKLGELEPGIRIISIGNHEPVSLRCSVSEDRQTIKVDRAK